MLWPTLTLRKLTKAATWSEELQLITQSWIHLCSRARTQKESNWTRRTVVWISSWEKKTWWMEKLSQWVDQCIQNWAELTSTESNLQPWSANSLKRKQTEWHYVDTFYLLIFIKFWTKCIDLWKKMAWFFWINWSDLEKRYISKMGVNVGLFLRECPSFLFWAW